MKQKYRSFDCQKEYVVITGVKSGVLKVAKKQKSESSSVKQEIVERFWLPKIECVCITDVKSGVLEVAKKQKNMWESSWYEHNITVWKQLNHLNTNPAHWSSNQNLPKANGDNYTKKKRHKKRNYWIKNPLAMMIELK